MKTKLFITGFLALFATLACDRAYYKMWEALGREKRDLLTSEIKQTRESQSKLQTEFVATFERIKKEYTFEGGEVENTYRALSKDYKALDERRNSVTKHVEKVDALAEDLFEEWRKEANDMNDTSLRSQSLTKLEQSQAKFAEVAQKYAGMLEVVNGSLKRLHDHVIFMKHNLNAQALGALKRELHAMQPELDRLVAEINRSIALASEFEGDLAD